MKNVKTGIISLLCCMSLLFASCDDGDKKNTGPVCGNQAIEAPEVCDGTALGTATCESEGFIGGTLVCAVTCDALDTSGCHRCGDQTISDGETCDGTDLGDEDCESLGFFGGTLGCANPKLIS